MMFPHQDWRKRPLQIIFSDFLLSLQLQKVKNNTFMWFWMVEINGLLGLTSSYIALEKQKL